MKAQRPVASPSRLSLKAKLAWRLRKTRSVTGRGKLLRCANDARRKDMASARQGVTQRYFV